MSGSAKGGNEGVSKDDTSTTIAGEQHSPRERCLQSALTIIRIVRAWSNIFGAGLRTANFASAHILMSAATVYLNEMTSVLQSSTTDNSEISNEAKDSKARQAGPFPPLDDFEAREKYGRDRINDDILPLLQEMSEYRPSPQQLKERLLKAMAEREDLLREHKRGGQKPSNPQKT